MLADDLRGHAGDHAPVRDIAADHGAGRDDHVAADPGARQDDRARAKPRARADADRAVHRELAADRGVQVLVAVVLVRDVDVGTSPDVVADRHGLVRHDVAAPADHAPVADRKQGQLEEILARQSACRQGHLLADEGIRTDLDSALTENGTRGKRHDRAVAEPPERPAPWCIRGYQAGPLEFAPPPVNGPPEHLAFCRADPQLKPHPPRHRVIVSSPCVRAR
jgi:hypothetical protein